MIIRIYRTFLKCLKFLELKINHLSYEEILLLLLIVQNFLDVTHFCTFEEHLQQMSLDSKAYFHFFVIVFYILSAIYFLNIVLYFFEVRFEVQSNNIISFYVLCVFIYNMFIIAQNISYQLKHTAWI